MTDRHKTSMCHPLIVGADGIEPTLRHPLIMVAEDDDEFRDYLCTELARDGYGVLPVGDGATAMEVLDMALIEPTAVMYPSLIITDIRMPRSDGFDLLAYSGFIPAIAITAFGDDETHRTARDLGAHFVLDKPFDAGDLRRAVRSLV